MHGYTTAFWRAAGIFLTGAVVCGALLPRRDVTRQEDAVQEGALVEAA